MSQTTTAPRGLDTMSDDDMALLRDMRDDTPDVPAAPPAERDPPAITDESVEIDLPDEDITPTKRGSRTETVPHAKFAAAIAERKAAKDAAAVEKTAREAAEKLVVEAEKRAVAAEQAQQIEQAKINERIAMLTALAQQSTQQAPAAPAPVVAPVAEEPLPDRNTDPIGYFEALFSRQEKARVADRAEIEALRGVQSGFQEQENQRRAVAELQNWGRVQEAAFTEKEPAYDAAMRFLRRNRHEELADLGVIDAAQREAQVADDITRIAIASRKEGVNFAERLYKQAVRRGFAKTAPAAEAPVATAAAVVIPPLDDELAAVDREARAEEGRRNSTTIGTLGSAPPGKMSVEAILALPDEQWDVMIKRMRAAGRIQEIMGS